MKYYSYISNSKLDMLFPQIPGNFLEDIKGELSVNFGLLKATLKDKDITPNRLSKLDAVVKYIDKHKPIGELDKPETYIRGTCHMYSTVLTDGMALFCWSGKHSEEDEKIHYLLLSGSTQHLIGMDLGDKYYPHSITNLVLKRLAELRKTQTELEEKLICDNGICVLESQQDYLDDIKRWASVQSGPKQKCEYLARTLINENSEDSNVVLATPIYIAMID